MPSLLSILVLVATPTAIFLLGWVLADRHQLEDRPALMWLNALSLPAAWILGAEAMLTLLIPDQTVWEAMFRSIALALAVLPAVMVFVLTILIAWSDKSEQK